VGSADDRPSGDAAFDSISVRFRITRRRPDALFCPDDKKAMTNGADITLERLAAPIPGE